MVEGVDIEKLIVTEYSSGGRIKGRFHFTVKNPNRNSIKNITNGAFDEIVDSN